MNKQVVFIAFVIIIVLPILLGIFGITPEQANHENRRLEPKPEFSLPRQDDHPKFTYIKGVILEISDFKDQYHTYYEDQFVLKPLLFKVYSGIQSQLFGTNPIPEKVVKGTDNWYFLGDFRSNAVRESKGLLNFNDQQLKKIHNNVAERQAWSKQNGIEYYIAIAPNKHSVCGEYLPILQNSNPTKLQQVKEMLKGKSFIDLGDYLRDSTHLRLYDKANTHWNGMGAYLGYLRLINAINLQFPDVGTLKIKDINLYTSYKEFDELTSMLSLAGNYERIEARILDPKFTPLSPRIESGTKNSPGTFERRFSCPKKPLKVLVFRDSFAAGLIKYIRESFGETVFLWSYEFNKELILKEKPDIVISEIVERNIDVLLEK